jgi:hypothetical protein
MALTKKQKRNLWLIVFAVGTVAILAVSDIWLFPAIERTTRGIRAFDLNPLGLSFADAKRFVQLLTEEAKRLYLQVELPLDCVFPLFYTPLFAMLMKRAYTGRRKDFLRAAPFLLAGFDYFENGCTAYLLTHPSFTETAASVARVATVGKSLLMYLTIAVVLWRLVKKALQKRKKKK